MPEHEQRLIGLAVSDAKLNWTNLDMRDAESSESTLVNLLVRSLVCACAPYAVQSFSFYC